MLDRIDSLSYGVLVAAMAIMTVLVVVQVVFRYVFANSIDWAEEVARLSFVWAMFLAIPHGLRKGIHVGIDALVVRLPEATQEHLFRLSAALGGFLMVVVLIYSLGAVRDSWSEMMPTLPVTSALYYIAVLIAAGHGLLHLALLAWGGRSCWEGVAPK